MAEFKKNDELLYKQWHRKGFLAVEYWPEGNKVVIDIGTLNDNGKGLAGSAKCWLDAYEFLAYLRAELMRNVSRSFPNYETKGWAVYGGNAKASRVFRAGFWMGNDATAREFNCEHYQPIMKEGGAIMPDTANPITKQKCKVTFAQLGQMFEAVQARIIAQSVRGIKVEDSVEPPAGVMVESSDDNKPKQGEVAEQAEHIGEF